MPVFVVVATRDHQQAEAQVARSFKDEERFALKDGVWLVDYAGTSRQLADKLGMRAPSSEGEETHVGVVFAITNYFGLALPDTWEWLGSRMARREG